MSPDVSHVRIHLELEYFIKIQSIEGDDDDIALASSLLCFSLATLLAASRLESERKLFAFNID